MTHPAAGDHRSEEDDFRVRVHEASHAICSRLLGLEIGGISVVWGKEYVARFSSETDDRRASMKSFGR
jgi:hypothetical protein